MVVGISEEDNTLFLFTYILEIGSSVFLSKRGKFRLIIEQTIKEESDVGQ